MCSAFSRIISSAGSTGGSGLHTGDGRGNTTAMTTSPTDRSDPGQEPPGNAFWDFSLRVYGEPGVQEECLTLQERLSLDVNLLLFAAYVGAKLGIALSGRDLAELIAATEDWHLSVVRRLRATRVAMKKWSEDKSDPLAAPAASLRSVIKQAELDAERIEHDRLALWASGRTANLTGTREQAVEQNLRLVIEHYTKASSNSADMPVRLIAAALA
jgi:uncharacterized protein (TIGR02444 family)